MMVDAVRSLTLGPAAERLFEHPPSRYVTRSLGRTVVLVVGFSALSAVLVRRRRSSVTLAEYMGGTNPPAERCMTRGFVGGR